MMWTKTAAAAAAAVATVAARKQAKSMLSIQFNFKHHQSDDFV